MPKILLLKMVFISQKHAVNIYSPLIQGEDYPPYKKWITWGYVVFEKLAD